MKWPTGNRAVDIMVAKKPQKARAGVTKMGITVTDILYNIKDKKKLG
jgi:hypothetical protein